MLTEAEIDQFETRGYLVVEDVLDTATLDAVRGEYADLLDRLYAGWQAEGRVGAPETPDFWGKLLTAYRAGCDWFQPMDISLPGDAITEDTVANGCLTAQPQEAEQEMLPHCPKVQTGIVDGFIDEDRATPLPVRAGGAVLFHPLTPHASLVNRTDGFRWSFDLRYHVTGEPSGRSWIPEFVARSRARPESVLGDWRRWRQMWEEAREHCADGPHRPIHRWASDSPFCA